MGVDREAITDRVVHAVATADVVLAVSPTLTEELGGPTARIRFFPNGCTPVSLTGAGSSDRAMLVGQLNDRLDVDALLAVAARGVPLTVIGPRREREEGTRQALDRLLAHPGVEWTGRIPQPEVAHRLADGAVGLTPYRDTAFNRASFPLKTLEYLASGLPVVSTELPASRWLDSDVVEVATSASAFADAAERRVLAGRSPAVDAACRRLASRHTLGCPRRRAGHHHPRPRSTGHLRPQPHPRQEILMSTVPFLDLVAQQAEVLDDVMADLGQVMATGAFVGGPQVDAFEREYAQFVGVEYCIGVANGTDAVEMALRAVGVGPGDEVVLPANTFVATAEAVARIGAVPVLVDVDHASLLMDPNLVSAVVTDRTRAVVPVHLYGQIAPLELIQAALGDRDIAVVEDAAQSQGASRQGVPSGAGGDVGATSFYPGKNLGAGGDAGAVTTDDAEVAHRVRLLGAHGSTVKYVHEAIGFNSRLDAVQAVVLRHKLRRLERWNELRRAAADRYRELLREVPGVTLPSVLAGNVPVWHLYVIRVPERDAVLASLHDAGVGAALHYPTPVHLTQAFAGLGHVAGDFPVAEEAADTLLSLPMFPHITTSQQERVVDVLGGALVGRV